MFGQCPARIGSWPRYLWTPANPGQAGRQAGWQATGLLSAPSALPFLLAPLRIERVESMSAGGPSLTAVTGAGALSAASASATAAHMTPLV